MVWLSFSKYKEWFMYIADYNYENGDLVYDDKKKYIVLNP